MKKFVRPLVAGAGIAGGLAAANRALRETVLPVNALGGQQLPWNWRGSEIFVTESGSGPTILLVHGLRAGGSSYEYRALAPLLAQHARVVALDLVGCGLSEKPNLSYSCELFVEHIVDALAEFTDEPVTLVGSGIGAAFAIRAATRAEDRVARVVAIGPSGNSGTFTREARLRGAALAGFLRSPLVGEAAYNVLARKNSLRWFLGHQVFGDPRAATPEVVEHVYALAHQPGARYVPAAYAGGMLDCEPARDLPFLTRPLAVLWGERASPLAPIADADDIVHLAQRATLTRFANSGLLPHFEEPEAVAAAITTFVAVQTS